jgi:hypothetical protein
MQAGHRWQNEFESLFTRKRRSRATIYGPVPPDGGLLYKYK